eukprot:CCRYP_011463-RA/>CCRYP_011463-RA protein AED:0.51 eAED:0.47 QI:0/0/0/1/0/0/2/0/64
MLKCMFNSSNLSCKNWTMETKPIHLDLFDVIKLMITSEESSIMSVKVELEEESGIDSKATIIDR